MGVDFMRDESEPGNLQLAWWKPGMKKHAVAKINPEDGNFPTWLNTELSRASDDMILFFIVTTTDIF